MTSCSVHYGRKVKGLCLSDIFLTCITLLPPLAKMAFIYVVYVCSKFLLSKGHLGSGVGWGEHLKTN